MWYRNKLLSLWLLFDVDRLNRVCRTRGSLALTVRWMLRLLRRDNDRRPPPEGDCDSARPAACANDAPRAQMEGALSRDAACSLLLSRRCAYGNNAIARYS